MHATKTHPQIGEMAENQQKIEDAIIFARKKIPVNGAVALEKKIVKRLKNWFFVQMLVETSKHEPKHSKPKYWGASWNVEARAIKSTVKTLKNNKVQTKTLRARLNVAHKKKIVLKFY